MIAFSRQTAVLMLLIATAALAQPAATRYVNPRFGYAIDVPAGFKTERAPANDDGRIFGSADGAHLTVWGSNNVSGDTAASLFAGDVARRGKSVVYKTLGANFYAVSWHEGTDVYYVRQYVGAGSSNGFSLTYPEKKAAYYGAVVRTLERSFRPGRLDRAH